LVTSLPANALLPAARIALALLKTTSSANVIIGALQIQRKNGICYGDGISKNVRVYF